LYSVTHKGRQSESEIAINGVIVVEKVMNGKSYAKGTRAHKLTWRVLLSQIQSYIETKNQDLEDLAHSLSEAAEKQ